MFHSSRPRKRRGIFSMRRPQRASHGRLRRLRHEPLESRVVLSAGPAGTEVNLDPADAAFETALVSAAPAASDTTSQEVLERFASAEELKQYLIEDALERWSHLFGKQASDFTPCVIETLKEYSRTGIDMPGVDEPSRAAADDRYLYSVAQHELVVREIGEDLQPVAVARLAFGDFVRGVFLTGDRLTILANGSGRGDSTKVTVLDVSDLTDPTILEQTLVDGIYIDARAVGDRVYLISQSDFFLPQPLVRGEADIKTFAPRYYETQEEYLERIEDQVLDLVLPGSAAFGSDGELVGAGWLVDPTDVVRPSSASQTHLSSIVVFDVGDDRTGSDDAVIVASSAPIEILISTDGLFVLGTQIQLWGNETFKKPTGGENRTSIFRLAADGEGGKIRFLAAGSVPGSLLSRYSAGIHDGYLAVATTQGSGDESNSALHVLQQEGESLDLVGRIEDIAVGERVDSIWFVGNSAYLATAPESPAFPAFYDQYDSPDLELACTIDLSDPAAPRLEAGLGLSGFGCYLKEIGDGMLLAIERDTASDARSPVVSLIDASDSSNPKVVDQYRIDNGRFSGSLFDYHSLAEYFPEQGILTVVSATSNQATGREVWVFRIDPSASGTEDDRAVQHLGRTQHGQDVSQAFQMGGKLVARSSYLATVHDFATPEQVLRQDEVLSVWIGSVQFYERENLVPPGEDRLFCFQASMTGYLTFDALFERTEQSDVTLTLYDRRMNELAVSESDYPWSQSRLDWRAKAGERFYLKVSGTATDVDLRILNAVSLEGELSDSVLRINSPKPDGDISFQIYWHTDTGRPWKDEPAGAAMTRRLSFDVAGVHYDIGMSAPNVVIEGSGQNALTVDVTPLTPSSQMRGDIVADLADGSGTISCSGPVFGTTGDGEEIGFHMAISDFREITVNGGDVARLRGSEGDDTFSAMPGLASMVTPGRVMRVNDFREVYAYSAPGQRDTARLYDSPGDDHLVATPEYAKIGGEGYYVRAKGFCCTLAYAKAGGNDTAKLKDSPGRDVCVATSEFVRMTGTGYANRVKFFEQVEVRSRRRSGDSTVLRDAVLAADSAEIDMDYLRTCVLFHGMEDFRMRGKSRDNRPEKETVNRLVAYWLE